MATSAPINGSQLMIRISTDNGLTWEIIGFAQSATLSRTVETRDITSKTSAGWRTLGSGTRSWSLSGDGLVTYVATVGATNPYSLHQIWESRTPLLVQFTAYNEAVSAPEPGDPHYEGDAFLTSLEETGGVEDNGSGGR